MSAGLSRARRWEARRLARILAGFSAETPWMPRRGAAEYRREVAWLFRCSEVLTVRDRARALGFLALQDEEIQALYVAPEARGRGVGKQLLDGAKARRGRLALWTCQANEAARRFYAREGFEVAGFGTGSGNEDRVPDIRLVWRGEG